MKANSPLAKRRTRLNRLDLAIRRYQQIVPKPVSHSDMPVRRLKIWLAEDVRTVLEDHVGRPSFQEHASWSIWALRVGAETPERELIERAAECLRDCAKALTTLSSRKLIQRRLKELFPRTARPVTVTAELQADGPAIGSAAFPTSVDAAVERSQIGEMAKRKSDLVNINDYFWPEQVHVKSSDGRVHQMAEAIVSLNPELLVPGNFIVRRLLQRVRMRFLTLESYRTKCLRALQQMRPRYREEKAAADKVWSDMVRLKGQLEVSFAAGQEIALRDACVGLTQLYGAIHPNPDLSWLGIGDSVAVPGLSLLRLQIRSLQNAEFFERIARALVDLKLLHGAADSNRSAIEEAIARGGLVLVQRSKEAYWETKKLKATLSSQQWTFLTALANKVRLGALVEISDVFGEKAVLPSAMSTAWGRLKPTLPPALRKLIQPGEVRATYRLDLETYRIHIFK